MNAELQTASGGADVSGCGGAIDAPTTRRRRADRVALLVGTWRRPAGSPRIGAAPVSDAGRPKTLLLYDGDCGLCDRSVAFALRHDRRDAFLAAALQSDVGGEVLRRHGLDPAALDSFRAVPDFGLPGERVLSKGRAALHVLRTIGGPWRLLTVVGVLPTALLDRGYDLVARNRRRLFGTPHACRALGPDERAKFLDRESGPDRGA